MIPLTLLSNDDDSRVARDRLELLSALIAAPGFDPLYCQDIIAVPGDHPVYGWGCAVEGCERPRRNHNGRLCERHSQEWLKVEQSGLTLGAFVEAADPLRATVGANVHSAESVVIGQLSPATRSCVNVITDGGI